MPVSMPRALGALTALLALGTPAWSQQKPPALSSDAEMELFELLNTPVTGASKREQRLIDSPQAIEVLTGDEIRQMGIYRLQDALKLMTGVDILEQDNGFNVVGMRGVMQQGQPRTVQVLIDGVPLYNAFASSIDIGNLPLPMDVIDKIEVVRGPSSTLYGANAVVGVIAITTKKAGNGLHGDVRGALADKRTSRWSTGMEWGTGGFGVTAGYQGASQGNTDRTGYAVGDLTHAAPLTMDAAGNPDGSHQQTGFARVDWKNDHTALWLSAGEGYRKYGQYQSVTSRWYDNKTLLAGWRETWSSVFATEVRLHQVTSNYQFHMQDASAASYAGARGLMGLTPVDISGSYTFADTTTRQIEVQANWDPSKDLHFVMGLDTRKVDMKKVIFLGLNQDETNSASGGFLAMDWTFVPGLTLSLGARAENEGLGGSRTSPRVTLVWAPTPTSVFRCGYYTSTRSPQMAETKVDYTFPSANSALGGQAPTYLVASQILPNELLKPEKSTNYELGYRQSIGALTLDLTLYQMKISDQITSVSMGTRIQVIQVPLPSPPYPAGTTVPENVPIFMTQFQNKGSATNKGAELALTWAVQKDWKVGLNGRYLQYTQDERATTLPLGAPAWVADEFSYAPKSTVTAWTRFSRGGFSGYFDVQHIGAAHVEALTASAFTFYNERPAYLQCDVQLGYEVVKGLSVGLYARNAAREYTLQGGAGPDRPFIYQVQRRELGGTLSYRF